MSTANKANRAANVTDWFRSQTCEGKFFEALREEMASDFDLEQKYYNHLSDFKI